MPKYLKIIFICLSIILGGIILVAASIFFTFIAKPYADRKLVESTVIGKEFVALYPGAVAYELNTREAVFLDISWGSTALRVTIPRNGKIAEYTLRCYQGTTNTTYYTLQGLSQEMIDYVTSEKCFEYEPDYKQLKRYRDESAFNFIFRYGINAKNELNTKDLITTGTTTTAFTLSPAELTNVQQKITELNLFNQTTSTNKNESTTTVTPCTSYYLQISDDKPQELSWDDCDGALTPTEQAFVNFIIPLIENHAEYKALPPATGGYL